VGDWRLEIEDWRVRVTVGWDVTEGRQAAKSSRNGSKKRRSWG
jgi:hypothetical protein